MVRESEKKTGSLMSIGRLPSFTCHKINLKKHHDRPSSRIINMAISKEQ